jgi:hypothetical protein
MSAYGVGILLLMHTLKQDFPEMEQPWYADDAGVARKFDNFRCHFCKLKKIGPNSIWKGPRLLWMVFDSRSP